MNLLPPGEGWYAASGEPSWHSEQDPRPLPLAPRRLNEGVRGKRPDPRMSEWRRCEQVLTHPPQGPGETGRGQLVVGAVQPQGRPNSLTETIKQNTFVPLGLAASEVRGVPGPSSLRPLCLDLKCLHPAPYASPTRSCHHPIPRTPGRHQPLLALRIDFIGFHQGQALSGDPERGVPGCARPLCPGGQVGSEGQKAVHPLARSLQERLPQLLLLWRGIHPGHLEPVAAAWARVEVTVT